MVMRLFLAYVVVEMAAIVALTATIGLGWTMLTLIAVFALGVVLSGSQLRRQLIALKRRLNDPRAQVTDSALVGFGTVLVLIPGLVTSTIGLLMLLPATRSMLRPAVAALAARRVAKLGVFDGLRPRTYIDGEVVDEVYVNRPALTAKPD